MERNFSGYMIENSIYLITDKQSNATERKAVLTMRVRFSVYADPDRALLCSDRELGYYFIQRVFDNA